MNSSTNFLSVGLRLYYEVFPNSQREFGIFGCCSSWTFPNSSKRWEIGFFEYKPRLDFQVFFQFTKELRNWDF